MPDPRPRTWNHHRASRLRLPDYPPGHPVHVVIGSHRHRTPFASAAVARSAFPILTSHERTIAAVLMPDHLHWVIDRADDLSRSVGTFKSLSTRLAWQAGHQGRLWQRSFFDTVIRDQDSLETTIRYVFANPVRAGLVKTVEEYPWVYCRFEIG